MADNSLTGFQILASQGLQNGEGIAPPNITANLNSYSNIPTVANFSNIFVTANSLPFGLTSANANLLLSLGANSFPHIFGQVPNDFSSNLGTGPLFTITPPRTTAWFGNSSTANVYLQVLGQAQTYATTAQSFLSSAAQTQWAGSPSISATGGFSAIGGNDPTNFQTIANVITQLGTLMVPSDPLSGFSNADCFNRILESGYDQIGNLHLTFFGQTIVDPVTGNNLIINSKLFQYILSNPIGLTDTDPFQVAALNPLDALLGEAANNALTQTGDLDAVVTFFGLGPNVAPAIYQWTDCLNLPLLFGPTLTQYISHILNLGTNTLSPYYFIKALVANIPGLTNISSLAVLGNTMAQITPLSNLDQVTSLPTPITQQQFSNLQSTFGPGSGTNGNPTVDDILGSTNYNQAMSNTILGLNPLLPTQTYGNISSDTGKIATVLTSNVFPVTLSDGTTYYDINSLAVGGSTLVNSSATTLASIAPSLTNTSLFTAYNGIAETHNNSITLSSPGAFVPINVIPLVTNALADYDEMSEFVGLIISIFQRYYGSSYIVKLDNPPQMAVYQKSLGAGDALTSFPQSLSSMASLGSQISNADEITGLNNVSNCFDMLSVTGQALAATVIEAKNTQVLNTNSLPIQSLAPNSIPFVTPPTGINTIGGGLIS
jgi:hypothetical protein